MDIITDMKIIEKYKKNIAYIESLGNIDDQKSYLASRIGAKICLKRTKYLLKLLGNPHKEIKNYIHVGGTSGKGSVSNYIHNILVAGGKKTALFTSPFVTETIEKYKLGDKLISVKEFVQIVEKIKPAIDECAEKSPYGIPSYFEVCFIIFVLFAVRNKCQYVVCEVGMGGEFDATNVVSRKKIAIITHVDYDHTEFLGNTLEKIATTKSKIISKKSIFFTNEPRALLRKIFKKQCQKVFASYNYVNKSADKICHKEKYFYFIYEGENYKIQNWGTHQVKNAILAINCAKSLNIKLSDTKKGLLKTKIPARFEIVRTKPYIILDVAHNPDKIKTTLDNLGLLNYKRLHIVYASAANKDLAKIANLCAGFCDHLYITKYFLTLRKCANPKNIKKYWQDANKKIKTNIFLDPHQAYEEAVKNAKTNDAILILGSFFLLGELRKIWYPSEKILQTRKVI